MSEKQSQWSALIRSEDWLAVWLGFLIIILVIAGLTIKTPKFKWTTEGEFKTLITEAIPNLDVIAKTAGEKGESAFQAQAVALKTAMEKGDRKGVADAAKKFQADAKGIKDASLKKKASQFGKEIGDGASNLTEKVFESENLSKSLYIGVGILILQRDRLGVYVGQHRSVRCWFPGSVHPGVAISVHSRQLYG